MCGWIRLLWVGFSSFFCEPVLFLRTEAGFRPGGRPTFLCKKVGKELAPMPTSLRFAAGNLRRQALGAVRQNSLRASLSVQTVAANMLTMQLHSAVQLPAPRTCRRRRGHKGQYRVRNSFFIYFNSCYRLL